MGTVLFSHGDGSHGDGSFSVTGDGSFDLSFRQVKRTVPVTEKNHPL